jgi:hypothetical protein
MTPDDRMPSTRHNHHTPKTIDFFQLVSNSAMEDPCFHFFGKRIIPAAAIKTAQDFFPVFSGLSPPVI